MAPIKPLAIDLFCGLGGWTEGLLAEGWDVIGFDIEKRPYPAQLVLQDVLTLHGSQFRDAALIVASPPCQQYSYRAMPWSRAKALPPPDNSLFEACFRIQKEAGGIPLVVENVRGAEKWVGPAKWKYGSFYLWGDIPALMPKNFKIKGIPHRPTGHWTNPVESGAIKQGGTWWHDSWSASVKWSSKSNQRKAWSAQIAKIPLPLAQHIARVYKPVI